MNVNYYPTINKALSFFKLADVPELKYRNARPLIEALQKIAYYSPRISGHILTRRTAIQSFDWQILSDDVEQAKLVKSKLSSFINFVINNYMDGVLFGIMAIIYDFSLVDGWIVPKFARSVSPNLLEYDGDYIYIYNAEVKQYTQLDANSLVYYIYNPYIRGGLLRSVLIPELLRNTTTLEWANLNQLLKGIITSFINPDKLTNAKALMQLTDDQISNNLNNIDNAVQNAEQYNYVRTLDFAEIKTQSIADAKSGTSYKLFIEALNADISIAFLGQANTAELPEHGGSRAALSVLNLIRSDILFSDLLNIKELVKSFLLKFYRANFNPNAEECPFSFDWVFDEKEDVEANARTFEYISRIGNVAVNSNEFYNKLGITRPDNAPDVITLGEKII